MSLRVVCNHHSTEATKVDLSAGATGDTQNISQELLTINSQTDPSSDTCLDLLKHCCVQDAHVIDTLPLLLAVEQQP